MHHDVQPIAEKSWPQDPRLGLRQEGTIRVSERPGRSRYRGTYIATAEFISKSAILRATRSGGVLT